MSASTFNLQSHAKPVPATVDPTPHIQALTRADFARPVADVEAELGGIPVAGRIPESDDAAMFANPEDPSEDDFAA